MGRIGRLGRGLGRRRLPPQAGGRVMERPVVNLHLVLCIVAIIVGVLVFANVLHVNAHEGFGLVLVALGVLLAL